ncbi:hypothetical protein SBA3_160009 [Candidatus Sulfopaludibacter sp. SbA3]|nr:hypothetical protein SBA3_160009 [Candidatus Sulfopaludibacter sp. SbA3]
MTCSSKCNAQRYQAASATAGWRMSKTAVALHFPKAHGSTMCIELRSNTHPCGRIS